MEILIFVIFGFLLGCVFTAWVSEPWEIFRLRYKRYDRIYFKDGKVVFSGGVVRRDFSAFFRVRGHKNDHDLPR